MTTLRACARATWRSRPSAGCRPTGSDAGCSARPLTPNRLMACAGERRRSALGVHPAGRRRRASRLAQTMLSAMRVIEHHALGLAILGNQHDARRDGVARTRAASAACPSSATVPAATGSAPAMARTSSVRPAPTMPAMPKISPAATVKADVAERSVGGRQAVDRQHLAAPAAAAMSGTGDRAAARPCLRRACGPAPARFVRWPRARRRAGRRCGRQMRAISSSRWLM